MPNDVLADGAKFLYLLTIPYIWIIWRHHFRYRNKMHILKVLYWFHTVLAPLYSAFALFYVVDFVYTAAISYLAWGLINFLFISTTLMLSKALTERFNEDR